MRIHLLSTEFDVLARPGGAGWSGRGVAVLDLARALAEAGHDVEVLCPHGDRDAVRNGTVPTVRDVDPDVGLGQRLTGIWRDRAPDVVHAWDVPAGIATAAVGGAPLVQSVRTPLRDAMPRRADRVVASSTAQHDELLRRGAHRDRLRVVPRGVDVDAWSPAGWSLRRTERPRIVFAGSVEQAGGADDAVAALRHVPDAELYVAGGPAPGGCGDSDLVRLQSAAAQAGVAGRIRLLGAVARKDIGSLLRSADVVVGPARSDVPGGTALEAMACGRPVVATAVGGQRDIVVDGVTGLLVRPTRVGELGAALRAVLADPATAQGYGIAGRDRAQARYSWSRITASMLEVYSDAVHGRRPVAAEEEPVAAG